MFRASSAHLQEDTVVYMQHTVLSLSTRVHDGLSVHSLSEFSPKCSSSGGYSYIHAAHGTVTLYESSWWPVGTQLEWVLTQVLIFRRIQLYTYSVRYCHSVREFVVACRYTAWVSSHSSAHLQEDTVVYMQHMVLSLCTRVRGGLSVHSLSENLDM